MRVPKTLRGCRLLEAKRSWPIDSRRLHPAPSLTHRVRMEQSSGHVPQDQATLDRDNPRPHRCNAATRPSLTHDQLPGPSMPQPLARGAVLAPSRVGSAAAHSAPPVLAQAQIGPMLCAHQVSLRIDRVQNYDVLLRPFPLREEGEKAVHYSPSSR